MANDEDAGAAAADEPSFLPPGPRRSTFTPPVGGQSSDAAAADAAGGSEAYDDDDLANALADQMARLNRSGPMPVVTPTQQSSPLSDLPAPSGPPVVLPQQSATGLPLAPQRRSLPDSELARLVDEQARTSGSTLDAMAALEGQLQLRQQEAAEFGEWERTMRDIGTPEALNSIEQARPAFRGVATPPVESAAPPFIEPAVAPPPQYQPADGPPAFEPAVFDPPAFAAPAYESPASPAYDPPASPAYDTPAEDPPAYDSPAYDSISEETTERPSRFSDSGFAPTPEFTPPAEPEPQVWDLVEPGLVPPPPTSPAPLAEFIEPQPAVPEVAEPDAVEADPLAAFNALLADRATTSAPLEYDPPQAPSQGPDLDDPVFIEPVGFVDAELSSVQTGSVQIVGQNPVPEPDDDVDDTDRAFDDLLGPFPMTAEGDVILPPVTGSAPVQPVSSPRVPSDEVVLGDEEPQKQSMFSLELAGMEPTPIEHRVGRSARLFWLWFATNSSVVSLAFGGVLFSLGMSLRQAIVAAFVGVAISFLPLGLTTLAGKWSGQPTMVVSRASFGLVGNGLPAILAIVTRLFWGGVLLWMIGATTARIIVGAQLGGPLDEFTLTLIAIGVGFALALVIAIFGYHLFSRIQLVLSILSAVLVIGLVAVTWPTVDVSTALTVGDGPWILVVTGVVLVFSFFGLIWANSSGDLARYQRPDSSGAASMLWGPFGTTLPAFILVAYGALLAASNPEVAEGLLTSPIDTIALMIPVWYPVPLIAATALSLLSGVVLSIYSGGFALQALGIRMPRPAAAVTIGVLVLAAAGAMVFSVDSIVPIFRDLATTLAVPVAAWAGIFAAEMILRRRGFDADSLLHLGGIYPAVRWVNLIMLIVATAVGLGLSTAAVDWLAWEGYLFGLIGVPLDSDLAGTDLGVLVALLLGLLTPLIAGVPAVRKQERALD